MYGALWRHLPGPVVVRLLLSLLLLLAVVAGLWFYVFPAVEARLPYNDVTVEEAARRGAPPADHSAS
jgi:hypothetical protein